MLNITYPDKYKDESSRVGKKFKYFKVEPIDMTPSSEKEKPKEVKIGKGSGRISTLENWRQNPQQGNINHYKRLYESLFAESFSDLIDPYLEDNDETTNSSITS